MPTSTATYIAQGLASGLGPRAALREARSNGLRVQDSRWYREYALARNRQALRYQEHDKPLNRKPEKIDGIWWIKNPAKVGFVYLVTIIHQDRETGATNTSYVSVKTKKLISRQKAIRLAIAKWADPNQKYPSRVLGAFVHGVYQLKVAP